MVSVCLQDPASLARPEGVLRVWRVGHEHPPLTRLLVGIGQHLFDPAPERPDVHAPHGGRLASALAFAFALLLVYRWAGALEGVAAGVFAALAVALMPRVFGHAHLASPEMISAAAMLAAWLTAIWAAERGGGRWLIAGVVLGVALLTKLTAVLVPVSVILALLVAWLAPSSLAIWGLIGGAFSSPVGRGSGRSTCPVSARGKADGSLA